MSYLLLFTVMYAVLAAGLPRLWAVTIPQVCLFACVAWVAHRKFREGSAARFPWFLAAPALLLIIGTAQLLAHSTVYALPTARAALDWAAYLACGWLTVQVTQAPTIRERLLVWWACFSGAVCACAILTAFTSPFHLFWLLQVRFEQVFGPYVYRNQLAAFVELSLPIVLYLAIRETERRALFLMIAAVQVSSVVVSASRTGLIMVGLELVVLLALAAQKRWFAPKASVTFALLLASCVLAGAGLAGFSTIEKRFAEKHPYQVRHEILLSTLHMARARPLVGWGLGNFRTVYPAYGRVDPGVLVNEAHNDWAQWAAEGGICAAVAMFLFAGWSSWVGLKTGWAIGVAAVFCHAFVDYPFEEPSLVLVIMLLSALAWNSVNREGSSKSHRHNVPPPSRPTAPESNPV